MTSFECQNTILFFVIRFSLFVFRLRHSDSFFVIRFSIFIFKSKFDFRFSFFDIHFQKLVCFVFCFSTFELRPTIKFLMSKI